MFAALQSLETAGCGLIHVLSNPFDWLKTNSHPSNRYREGKYHTTGVPSDGKKRIKDEMNDLTKMVNASHASLRIFTSLVEAVNRHDVPKPGDTEVSCFLCSALTEAQYVLADTENELKSYAVCCGRFRLLTATVQTKSAPDLKYNKEITWKTWAGRLPDRYNDKLTAATKVLQDLLSHCNTTLSHLTQLHCDHEFNQYLAEDLKKVTVDEFWTDFKDGEMTIDAFLASAPKLGFAVPSGGSAVTVLSQLLPDKGLINAVLCLMLVTADSKTFTKDGLRSFVHCFGPLKDCFKKVGFASSSLLTLCCTGAHVV